MNFERKMLGRGRIKFLILHFFLSEVATDIIENGQIINKILADNFFKGTPNFLSRISILLLGSFFGQQKIFQFMFLEIIY